MKTDELIERLAQDAVVKRRLLPLMNIALVTGALLTSCLLLTAFGLRADLASQVETLRVSAKITISLLFALGSVLLVRRIGQPGVAIRPIAVFLLVPAGLLVVATGTELMVLPRGAWLANLLGRNSLFCLVAVPLLALPPLARDDSACQRGLQSRPVGRIVVVDINARAGHCGTKSGDNVRDGCRFVVTRQKDGHIETVQNSPVQVCTIPSHRHFLA